MWARGGLHFRTRQRQCIPHDHSHRGFARLDSTDLYEWIAQDLDHSCFVLVARESILACVGYPREQLRRCEGASIPDLIGENCRLLFVGINPGLQTAMTGIHFAHPSNRFWPALEKAGLIDWVPNVSPAAPSVRVDVDDLPWTAATQTHFCHPSNRFYPALRQGRWIDWEIDTDTGMTDQQRSDFVAAGVGITNLVERATVRASELSREELRSGAARLAETVRRIRPKVVAVAGVTAYRDAFGDRHAVMGRQTDPLAGAELWVVPNPSGLNAHETVESLSQWYRKVADRGRGVD